MEHKILDRSQQDPANCWALEDLYATPADWERDLAELKDLTGKLAGCGNCALREKCSYRKEGTTCV